MIKNYEAKIAFALLSIKMKNKKALFTSCENCKSAAKGFQDLQLLSEDQFPIGYIDPATEFIANLLKMCHLYIAQALVKRDAGFIGLSYAPHYRMHVQLPQFSNERFI
jgi:hypothetical protein